ncbi:hypothetical protein [Flavobacterium suncheonense]|uniref:Cytochrome C n=1 Tax=Flavobacterium suncheonense GH29-5 = DSM 17707 TaxID=1121899 RepID=A0A0A2MH91_9FLAO|nr:hypothetical protein [Flavobacterium suncheonense]KGO90823.1 hypothetical protein Q764_01515 [Flavobacterium suncheonense GH29-5 = DSM 17707]
MKKVFVFLVTAVLTFSCGKKEENKGEETTAVKEEKQFEMYEMSEMAALMEQMYVDNQRLKERIKAGDTIGQFPSHFMRIHSAVMTDKQENDAFFKEQAANFIKAQELIYKDPANAKKHFNNGVDACIKCHEVKCGGPIPRIKKLYIE